MSYTVYVIFIFTKIWGHSVTTTRLITDDIKKVAGSKVTIFFQHRLSILGGEFTNNRDVLLYIQNLAVTQINILPSSRLTPFKLNFYKKNGFIPMRMRTFLKLREIHV